MASELFKPSAQTRLNIPYVPSIIKQAVNRGDISKQEVRQEYIRLSNIMRKRQRAILKNSNYKNYADNHDIKYVNDIKSETELYKELSYLAGRLNAPTATVTGIKGIIERTIDTLNYIKESPEGDILRNSVKHIKNADDLKQFSDFMEAKRSTVEKELWKYVSSEWVDEWNESGDIAGSQLEME